MGQRYRPVGGAPSLIRTCAGSAPAPARGRVVGTARGTPKLRGDRRPRLAGRAPPRPARHRARHRATSSSTGAGSLARRGSTTITCSPRGSTVADVVDGVGEPAAPDLLVELGELAGDRDAPVGPAGIARGRRASPRPGAGPRTARRCAPRRRSPRAAPPGRAPLRGRKPSNTKRSVGSPESDERVEHGAGPGDDLDREAGVEARADELRTGIGDAGHPRVGRRTRPSHRHGSRRRAAPRARARCARARRAAARPTGRPRA